MPMNARETVEIMIRTNRSSMTVWSPPEVQRALDAYRAEILREAADRVTPDDLCVCQDCETCMARALAAFLRRMAEEQP